MGDAITWLLQMLADVVGPYVVLAYLLAVVIFIVAVAVSVHGLRANYRRTRGLDLSGMRHARR